MALKRDGVVVGPGPNDETKWCLLAAFLDKLNLPTDQVKRDYLDGGKWKLGQGRGRRLREDQDWCYKKGKRGGGRGKGLLHVKVHVLKDVYCKYYGNRQLRS